MKNLLCAVMSAIALICGSQSANAQYCLENYALYAGISGGAVQANGFTSPSFGISLGIDSYRFLGELEISYISMNSIYGNNEKETLSTINIGVVCGVKALTSRYGYLAITIAMGDALQKGWDSYYTYDYSWSYGWNSGYASHYQRKYYGKYYFGFGLNAGINISQNIQIFADARYQSIPLDGCRTTTWAPIIKGGIKFLF